MPRVTKEYNVRRNEILQMAQSLVFVKGFELMTIQDVLDSLHISKGAFYHYFDSKQALLEAMINQMTGEIEAVLTPLVNDPAISALEKFYRFFDTSARWKTAQKEYILQFLGSWYKDENTIVRSKVTLAAITLIMPLFSRIIKQGVEEGIFSSEYSENIGEVVMGMMQCMGETIARMILSDFSGRPVEINLVKKTVAAYTYAMERVLGCKPGTLHFFDEEMFKVWFSTTGFKNEWTQEVIHDLDNFLSL